MLAFAVGSPRSGRVGRGAESQADPMLDGAWRAPGSGGADRSSLGAVVHLAIGERARRAVTTAGRCAVRPGHRAAAARHPQRLAGNAYLLRATERSSWATPPSRCSPSTAADAILVRLPDPGDLRRRAERLRHRSAAATRHVTEFGEKLSAREAAVLRLAAEGLTQREIADQLVISYNTVKTHFKATYRKLGVASREAAIERLNQLDAAPRERRPPG